MPEPLSAPPRITDAMLGSIRSFAHQLRRAPLSEVEADTILYHLPELLDELAERRGQAAPARLTDRPARAALSVIEGEGA